MWPRVPLPGEMTRHSTSLVSEEIAAHMSACEAHLLSEIDWDKIHFAAIETRGSQAASQLTPGFFGGKQLLPNTHQYVV